MHRYRGHRRDEEGMTTALVELAGVEATLPHMRAVPGEVFNYELQEAIEATFMVRVAELVIRSAIERRESRGHHFRTDHLASDAEDDVTHTLIRRDESGNAE